MTGTGLSGACAEAMPLNVSAAIARTGMIGLGFLLMSRFCKALDKRVPANASDQKRADMQAEKLACALDL